MISLFIQGGLFMWPLLLVAIVIIVLSIKKTIEITPTTKLNPKIEKGVNAIPFWGAMAVLVGFLAHYWGITMAMDAITKANDISPSIVAQGYKVSLITIIFGLLIFMFSAIIWFILRWKIQTLSSQNK